MSLALRARAQGLAAAHPPLLVAARRLAATITAGRHGRRQAGPGEDFWQYRPYAPGDSSQRIDWRKSARAAHALVRENEWAAANMLWLWSGRGGGMDWRSALSSVTKADRAALLAMTLGVLAAEAGENIGLVGHGRVSLPRLAELLTGAPTELVPPARTLVLIGDFLEPLEAITARLTRFGESAGHMVQVLDPAEETFPWSGRIEFRAVASDARLILARTESLRRAYQDRLLAQREGLKDLCRRLGWTFALHHTDQPPQRPLLALHARLSR